MNDLSQRLGIAVRDLGTWSLAAAQSGTSMAAIGVGVKSLSGFMARHSEELQKAGITATDANGAMIQLADLFAAMPDGIEKTALATKLFGRSGAELIPLLNGGSVELEKVKNKAADYAAQLEELAPLADEFNDLLAELELQSETTGLAFAKELIGPLTEAAELFKDARSGADGFHNAMKRLQTLTNSGPLSIFGAAADLSERGGAAHRAAALAGMGGDEKKRGASGLIAGGAGDMARFDEATERYLKENAARLRAMAPLNKPNGGSNKSEKRTRPFDPEVDLWYAIDEAQRKKHRAALNESDKALDRDAEAMAKNAEKIKDSIEPLRVLERQIAEVNTLRTAGEISANEAWIAETKLTAAFNEQNGKLKDLAKTGEDSFGSIKESIENMGNKAADTFAELLVTGKGSFTDLINSWLKDITRLQAKKMMDPITKGATDWLGDLFGGGFYKYGGAALDVGNMSANGNAFDSHGVMPFANGGIVTRPTLFPFAKGIGLMGEAGPEAIMPLTRGANGKLGVQASGGGSAQPSRIEIINQTSRPAVVSQADTHFDAEGMVTTIVIRDLAGNGRIANVIQRQYGLNRAAGVF